MSTSASVPVSTARDRDRLWTTRTWPTVASMWVLQFFIAFEAVSIATVLPVITSDLDARSWYSLAFAATLTTGLVGMIIGGAWADRNGVGIPLTVGGGVFAAGIGLCAVSPTVVVFVAGRLLQGFGGGVVTVLLYVVIAKVISEATRPRMFGLLTTAWVLPSMVGPLAAGMVLEITHWRVLFAVVTACAGVALAVLLGSIRRYRLPAGTGAGAVFGRRGWRASAAAIALLAVHLSSQQPQAFRYLLFAAGLIVLVAIGIRLLPAGTFRAARGAPRLVALRAILGAAVASTDVYIPLYLQAERDLRPALAGLLIAIGALGWATGASIQGRRAEQGRPATLLRVATSLVVAGPLGAALVIAGLTPIWTIAITSIVMGIGLGLAYPIVTATTLTLSAPDQHGFYSSSLQAGESIATSAFLALTALMLTSVPSNSYLITYTVIGLVAVLACVTGWSAMPPYHRTNGDSPR